MPLDLKAYSQLKKIGICAHSYEGGALCFLTACRAGAEQLGPHLHPHILLSAIPMGLSMPAWEADDYEEIAKYLGQGVKELAQSGADFFICPDNTGHIVLEKIIDRLPIPGLHIADVVCQEIVARGWQKVALLGTKWTMTGTVYGEALERHGLMRMVPNDTARQHINEAIFEELCQGIFKPSTIDYFIEVIAALKTQGAECVILGCTEIPLIINADNSPLPILDSTRLLAQGAVRLVISSTPLPEQGWISL